MSGNTVDAEFAVMIVVPGRALVPAMVSLAYTSEDPYAVRIVFRVGLDWPIAWSCARELLSAGLEGREGPGDVAVWPSVDPDGTALLHIEVSSPEGRAHVQAPWGEVSGFLSLTYALVAAGQEAGQIDVEAELNELLRGAL